MVDDIAVKSSLRKAQTGIQLLDIVASQQAQRHLEQTRRSQREEWTLTESFLKETRNRHGESTCSGLKAETDAHSSQGMMEADELEDLGTSLRSSGHAMTFTGPREQGILDLAQVISSERKNLEEILSRPQLRLSDVMREKRDLNQSTLQQLQTGQKFDKILEPVEPRDRTETASMPEWVRSRLSDHGSHGDHEELKSFSSLQYPG